MSWRLIAVIVLALGMGLVFGGLRVSVAAGNAAQFGRVSQLANLGQQVTGLVQALENERDETTGLLPITKPKDLQRWYDATDAAAARVRRLAAGINGSFPANIQARVATVVSVITNLNALRGTAQASQSALAVIADYVGPDQQHDRPQRPDRAGHVGLRPRQRRPDAQLAVPGQGPGRSAARAPVQRAQPADLRGRSAAGADHRPVRGTHRPDRVRHHGYRPGAERLPEHRGRPAGEPGAEHRDLHRGHRQPGHRRGRPGHQPGGGAREVVRGPVRHDRRHAAGRAEHSPENRRRGPGRCRAARNGPR